MNAVERLVLKFEDMCGESDTEMGRAALKEHQDALDTNNKTMCAYCGFVHEDKNNMVEIIDHIMKCEKRPERKLLDKAFEVEDRLYQRIIHLTEDGYKPDSCESCKEIKEILRIYLEPNDLQPVQESFQDAVRNDPDMTAEQKAYWLSQPPAGAKPIQGYVVCSACGTRVDVDDAESVYNAELDDVSFYCKKCTEEAEE